MRDNFFPVLSSQNFLLFPSPACTTTCLMDTFTLHDLAFNVPFFALNRKFLIDLMPILGLQEWKMGFSGLIFSDCMRAKC